MISHLIVLENFEPVDDADYFLFFIVYTSFSASFNTLAQHQYSCGLLFNDAEAFGGQIPCSKTHWRLFLEHRSQRWFMFPDFLQSGNILVPGASLYLLPYTTSKCISRVWLLVDVWACCPAGLGSVSRSGPVKSSSYGPLIYLNSRCVCGFVWVWERDFGSIKTGLTLRARKKGINYYLHPVVSRLHVSEKTQIHVISPIPIQLASLL